MKKILYLFALCASATAYSQQSSDKPVVIIDGMLASKSLVANDAKNIQSTNVYKTTADLPTKLKSFESLAANGLISIQVKDNFYDKIPLKALNSEFNLAPNTPVLFDGHLIMNTELFVLGNVLEHMEVKVVDGNKILSISTVEKKTSTTALK